MPYALNPKFIDHIVLMVKNVYKSEVFYSKFLGKPISKDKYSIAYKIGGTKLFFAYFTPDSTRPFFFGSLGGQADIINP